jgi:short-subunit dehydrogenase
VITGATGDLGAALAVRYALPDRTLALTGRDATRLDQICSRCRALGAEVDSNALDIRDRPALRDWLHALAGRRLIDLLIVNAGVTSNTGPDRSGEDWGAIAETLEVNLVGALATADAVLPSMRARQHGQIAFISSLSAFFGLPSTPAYCASKAGIKAYAEAWRGWLAPQGVAVNLVCPGFIDTPMSARFPGPRPFMLSAERAAALIARRLAANPARISFPFPLNAGMWFLSVFPPRLSLAIVRQLGY